MFFLLILLSIFLSILLLQNPIKEAFDACCGIKGSTINSHVPLTLPPSLLPNCKKRRKSYKCITCTDDLDCPFPLRCCNGNCTPQILIEKIRGNNQWVPLRMTTCPPKMYNKRCQNNDFCQNNHLTCAGCTNSTSCLNSANCLSKCKPVPIYYSGVFEDIQA